jgi:hypothetical protein
LSVGVQQLSNKRLRTGMDFDDDHALCALRRRLPKDLHGAAVCEQISDTPTRHIFGVFNGRDAGPG